jgi:hypothetical protein
MLAQQLGPEPDRMTSLPSLINFQTTEHPAGGLYQEI